MADFHDEIDLSLDDLLEKCNVSGDSSGDDELDPACLHEEELDPKTAGQILQDSAEPCDNETGDVTQESTQNDVNESDGNNQGCEVGSSSTYSGVNSSSSSSSSSSGDSVDGDKKDSINESWQDLDKALEAKAQGNEWFKMGNMTEAAASYTEAIDLCPSTNVEELATFYGNRSACFASLGDHDCVLEDCTAALEHKPDYVKVLARRAASYEAVEKLDQVQLSERSLTHPPQTHTLELKNTNYRLISCCHCAQALEDLKKIQELDASYPKIAPRVAVLSKKVDEKNEKLKDEALGKLKDLGNTILGNFGMSLDDFKMQQDPSTGSWSINMGNKG
jgi:tetratricopeptide (TPR) repeat protein